MLTVGVLSHDYGRFMGDALDSVFTQTVVPHQVIVAEDGSTDDTDSVLSRYEGRITVIRSASPHGGAAWGRQAILDAATGSYVLFLSADDFLCSETALEELLNVAHATGADWVYHDLALVDADGANVLQEWVYSGWPTEPYAGLRNCYAKLGVGVPMSGLFSMDFIRRNSLKWHSWRDTGRGEDGCTCIHWLLRGPRIAYLPGKMLAYRQHGKNVTANDADGRMKAAANVQAFFATPLSELIGG